jgi:hypothetical protein
MRCLPFFLLTVAAFGQTEHKPKPEDYPAHTQASVLGKTVGLGAEFMVHSFSAGEDSYIAPAFLVVEVALYPEKGGTLQVSPTQFTLRINGKKQPLIAQPPGLVASSLSHPEGNQRPRFQLGGGMGGIGAGTGQPRPNTMPGQDPQQMPRDNSGEERRPRVKPEELVVKTALPQGEFKGPVSGFLYFSYKGKAGSIKSLELLYEDAVIKLR